MGIASKPAQHTSRLANIQALRGIAVLLVVLSHLMSVERNYAGDRLLGDALIFGFSGVDLFFAISGFVMVYVAWDAPNTMRTSASFLFARIGRIYPLYWLVSLIVLGLWLVRPDFVFASNAQVSLVKSFVLWPANHPPLLAVGWTLIHEMYFYLVFSLLLLVSRRFRPLVLLVWAIVILTGFIFGAGVNAPGFRLLTNPLTFEFLGGAAAALVYRRFGGHGWALALISGALLFAAACFVSVKTGIGFWESWPRAASFTPGISLLVYGAAGAEKAGRNFHQALVWLGNQSYALYLSHILTLAALGRLWALFAKEGIWDNVLMLPLMLIGALLGAQVLHRFVEMPLLMVVKWMRRRLF